ncbi:MAG: diacylglycerol kinase family lipid kinase [Ideonella sp.]|nr:diacylglycerol kinase family lipid kinase [Ideonella sp.]
MLESAFGTTEAAGRWRVMPTARPCALVLLNPHAAGGRAARLVAPLEQALVGTGARLVVTNSVAQARAELLAQPRGHRVVVAGGDGSLQQLLPSLLARQHELALLPCGTGNDTARAFGVHRLPWPEALDLGLRAPAQPIDVGEAEHDGRRTPFISSLCAGFDAAVAERALNGPQWLRGMPRYLWATVLEIAALRSHALRVQVDGVTVHDGPALFASSLNTPSYGSGMPAAPKARIDDGRLQLLLTGRFGRLGALAMMPLLSTGLHLWHPNVRCQPFREMDISSATPLPLAADGEVLPATAGLTVRVRAGALQAVRQTVA